MQQISRLGRGVLAKPCMLADHHLPRALAEFGMIDPGAGERLFATAAAGRRVAARLSR